jgi:hypothetical protein
MRGIFLFHNDVDLPSTVFVAMKYISCIFVTLWYHRHYAQFDFNQSAYLPGHLTAADLFATSDCHVAISSGLSTGTHQQTAHGVRRRVLQPCESAQRPAPPQVPREFWDRE